MPMIEVTISELQNAASKISQSNEALRETAAALKAAADDLASAWEGNAREAFVAEQEQIDAWYKQMAECVETYVGTMKTAAQKYVNTEAEAVKLIKG